MLTNIGAVVGAAGQLRQVPGAGPAAGLGDGRGALGPEAHLLHPRHHAGRVRHHAGALIKTDRAVSAGFVATAPMLLPPWLTNFFSVAACCSSCRKLCASADT